VNIIDAHVHLINLDQGIYSWLRNDHPPHWPQKKTIRRSFFQSSLTLTAPFQLKGFVHVEAGMNNDKPWQEVEWLENHSTLPFCNIAYTDLSDSHSVTLNKVLNYSSVVGIRNIITKGDEAKLNDRAFIQNLKKLSDKGCLLDLGIDITNANAIKSLCHILQRLPDLNIIIDHIGINASSLTWKENAQTLGVHDNCYV